MQNKKAAKKRVWVLFPDGGTPREGYGERHFSLAREYGDDFETTIFASTHSHLFRSAKKISLIYEKEQIEPGLSYVWLRGLKYFNSNSPKRVMFWFYFSIFVFVRGLFAIRKPNVIVVSSMPMFSIFPAVGLRWLFGVKVVFEIRDIWPLSLYALSDVTEKHPFAKLLTFTEKFAYKKANHVVSVLRRADLHIENVLCRPVDSYTWISNGFSSRLCEIDSDYAKELIEKNQLDDGKLNVGYVGTLGEANAMEYFFEACKKLGQENVRFVIVGNGPLKEKYAEELKDQSNITFLDRVEKRLVQTILSQLDLLYIASRNRKLYEYGISANKLFDYMLSGTPVLMSTNEREPLIKLADCGLIVPPEDVLAIMEGIRKILQMNLTERERMGERGYKYVIRNFSYSQLGAKYVEIFNE